MRIAQIAPPWFAVPPSGYGGIELVVALLADGLTEQGHDVTLFASGGSQTKATLVSPMADPPDPALLGNPWFDAYHALSAYLAIGDEFDRRAGLPLAMVIKKNEPFERAYWDEIVAPLLNDEVEVYEAISHEQKTDLLGRARAMVFPIQWPEPFGLVMAEAMACGTPVV